MITGINNSFLSWLYGQLVNDPQMDLLTFDLYNKIGALTETTFPCIISGANATISAGNVNITDGFFRVADQSPTFLNTVATNIQGFMNSTATSIAVIPNYYIVASLTILPAASGQTTYNFVGSYQLIPDLTPLNYNAATMVILGQISNDGTYVIFTERNKDYGNLLNSLATQNINLKNSNYTILATDTQVVSTSGSAITYTLPLRTTLGQNYQVTILNLGTANLTISGNGLNIIGNSTLILKQYATIVLTYMQTTQEWIAIYSGGETFPDITDIAGKVTITGSNGFQVNNLTSLLGPFNALVTTAALTYRISNTDTPGTYLMQVSEPLTNNYGRVSVSGDTVTHTGIASLAAATNGIEQYNLTVSTNRRPAIFANLPGDITGVPLPNDILLGANLSGNLGMNGYQKFPNGLIIQWLVGSSTNVQIGSFTWPIAFPHACVSAHATLQLGGSGGDSVTQVIASNFTGYICYNQVLIPTRFFYVFGIGY